MSEPAMRLEEGQGHLELTGGRVWYEVAGAGEATPLLVLHGGPGFTHEYVRSLEDLRGERPVIFYDQLGCGRSPRPPNAELCTTEYFVEELAEVRQQLGLDRVHILGQSWGTMLAVEYMLTRPEGVLSLVLASPCISIPRWVEDANRLRAELPEDLRAVIDRHEAAGYTGCPEYLAAMLVYYKRHVCRLDPWPDEVERAFAGHGPEVYETMWGPSEFTVSGNLGDFDRSSRLGEIGVPALFTCGRHDEATPEALAWYQSLLPGSELAVFEESSHMAHLEERERYMRVVSDFLVRTERPRLRSSLREG
jgi:proline iminopeptidase